MKTQHSQKINTSFKKVHFIFAFNFHFGFVCWRRRLKRSAFEKRNKQTNKTKNGWRKAEAQSLRWNTGWSQRESEELDLLIGSSMQRQLLNLLTGMNLYQPHEEGKYLRQPPVWLVKE